MSKKELTNKQKTLASIAFSLMGVFIVLLSLGVISTDEADKHAPDWVIGACGAIFLITGIMIKTGDRGRRSDFLGGFLLLAFGLVGGWVAVFGSGEHMSGGFAFASQDSNITLARLVFGLGSLICFSVSAYAFRRFFRSSSEFKRHSQKSTRS